MLILYDFQHKNIVPQTNSQVNKKIKFVDFYWLRGNINTGGNKYEKTNYWLGI